MRSILLPLNLRTSMPPYRQARPPATATTRRKWRISTARRAINGVTTNPLLIWQSRRGGTRSHSTYLSVLISLLTGKLRYYGGNAGRRTRFGAWPKRMLLPHSGPSAPRSPAKFTKFWSIRRRTSRAKCESESSRAPMITIRSPGRANLTSASPQKPRSGNAKALRPYR